ncbi:MAG: TonB-dependent receptor, partial [Bacteroidetes bacterium]
MKKNKTFRLLLIYLSFPVFILPAIAFERVDNEFVLLNPGQEAGPAPDTLLRQLEEVVVTAFNRREDIIKIPGALTSVGQIVLQRESPPINILPVFDHVPGVFAQEGATNTSRVVIRGTGARVPYATGKIRAYFNNIPLTNTSGETFIQDIDPAMIQSMEVIKGPAPSIYGAGLGGTIVLNALDPAARTTGISNTSRAGAFGLIQNTTTFDYVRDNHATSVGYSYTESDGYRENNEFRRHAITLVNQFAPGNTELTSLLSFSDLRHHIPSSIDSVTFADNPQAAAANWLRTRGYEDARRLLAGVNASHQTLPQLTTNWSVFGVWHDEKELRPFDVYYQERLTLGTRLRMVYNQPLRMGELELSAGGEAFTENYQYSNHENIGGEGVQGDPFSDNSEQVGSWNLFSQADATFGSFTLSGGVNLNFTQRDYRDNFTTGNQNLTGVYDYGLMISPRLAAGYLYAGQNAVYVSVSHGFAPPSLDETLTPEGTINPDIMPETSWNYEVGFRGKLSGGRFFYDLSLYNMQVQNLLVAERVGEDAWIGRNAGASLHRGL